MTTTRVLLLTGDGIAGSLLVDGSGRATLTPPPAPEAPWPPAAPGERIVLAVPGECVRAQWLALAAHSEAQARTLALASIAGDLAEPADGTHVAIGAPSGPGMPRLLLATSRDRMRGWLQHAAALGVRPDMVVPDYLLLAAGEPPAVATHHGAWLVRGNAMAFTAEPALAMQLLATVDVAPEAEPAPLQSCVLSVSPDASIPDLRQGEFLPVARGNPSRSRRRLALWAALLLASPLLLTLAEGLVHHARIRANDAFSTVIATRLGLEPGPRGSAAVVHDERILLESGERFAAEAGAVFAAVDAQAGAMLERFDYTEQAIEAVVRHRDAAAADAISASLQQAGFQVQVAAGARSGDFQLTTFRIGRTP